MNNSITTDIRKLERYILNLPLAKKLNTLSRQQRDLMMDLRDSVADARKSIVLYSGSDDVEDQIKFLEDSIEQIKLVNDQIIIASQHDLLGVVDVAHLSALAESIKERLQ